MRAWHAMHTERVSTLRVRKPVSCRELDSAHPEALVATAVTGSNRRGPRGRSKLWMRSPVTGEYSSRNAASATLPLSRPPRPLPTRRTSMLPGAKGACGKWSGAHSAEGLGVPVLVVVGVFVADDEDVPVCEGDPVLVAVADAVAPNVELDVAVAVCEGVMEDVDVALALGEGASGARSSDRHCVFAQGVASRVASSVAVLSRMIPSLVAKSRWNCPPMVMPARPRPPLTVRTLPSPAV